MTMHGEDDPITLLSELLCEGVERTTAQAYGRPRAPVIAALVRAGILIPDGVIDTTICDACDVHHLVEVVSGGPDGSYGWHCPEVGFVPADPDAVAALSVQTDRVVAALSKAFTAEFGTRRWRSRPLEGADAWLVGAWSIGGAWTTVALARGLGCAAAARQTTNALEALVQNDAGLVLTIGNDAGFEAPRRFAVVPLTASLILDAEEHLLVAADVLMRAVATHAARDWVAHAGRPSVEAKVFAVLDGLVSRGLSEVNSGVVSRAWPEFHPGEQPPSSGTLRRHIRRWRSSCRLRSDL
jgi:hypothetical protein